MLAIIRHQTRPRSPIKIWTNRITRKLTISTLLTPPLVFTGLLLSLWTYKCIIMVIFQNKIIYMPSVPPFSRSEKIADYAPQCRGLKWEERRTRAADGVDIALAVTSVNGTRENNDESAKEAPSSSSQVAIVYFQGSVEQSIVVIWLWMSGSKI